MQQSIHLRRAAWTTLSIAIGAAACVFLFNEWFTGVLLPALGISQPLAAAAGVFLIVLSTCLANRIFSVVPCHAEHLATEESTQNPDERSEDFIRAADEVSKELRQIRTLNDVLRNQLSLITTETEKAAFDITSRIHGIDEIVSNLPQVADNRTLTTPSDTSIIQHPQRIEQVSQKAHSLLQLVELIKKTSAQTNLLTLNAAIDAEHAGLTGRGFVAVANEIRQLSKQTEDTVEQINQCVAQVIAAIDAPFLERFDPSTRNEAHSLQNFHTQSDKPGDTPPEMSAMDAQVTTNAYQSSQQLSGMFMDVMASVQFQDVTRQQIEYVASALDRVDEHCNRLAERLDAFHDPDFTLQPLSVHLKEIYSNYVMQSQRSGHQTATDTAQDSQGDGPKIELF